jgi:Rad52/22 family double-strand break repair protein
MSLREQAHAEAAQRPAPPDDPDGLSQERPGGAPSAVVAAAEQQALERSVERAVVASPARSAPSAPIVVQGTPLELTPQQYQVLLSGINKNRVGTKDRQSHLEAWDVRRYLTKIFGFGGWNVQTVELIKIHEQISPPGTIKVNKWVGGQKTRVANENTAYTVVYSAQVRLNIYNPDGTVGAFYEDAATGDGINMPSYQAAADFAIKTALSQALKRCAVNLGDQFGLSLYNHGSLNPQVEVTLRPPTEIPVAQVEQVVRSELVQGEEPDPAADAPSLDLPTANELRDEAVDPHTASARLSQMYRMVHRSKGDHPQLGTQRVINEQGDEEALDSLIYRKFQESRQA